MSIGAGGAAPGAEMAAPRWRTAVVGGGLVWLGARALITAVAAVSQLSAGSPGLARSDGFLGLLANWDSAYFLGIARDGYFGADSSATWPAFFPGYPLAARGVGLLLDPAGPDDTALLAGTLLVSALGGLVAAILLWRLAEESGGRRAALLATALVFVGPYSLFLAASYSESRPISPSSRPATFDSNAWNALVASSALARAASRAAMRRVVCSAAFSVRLLNEPT